MTDPVWSVILLLGVGLLFTVYIIYDILHLAYLEAKDETTSTHPINNKSSD
jgi:hypothetical protein